MPDPRSSSALPSASSPTPPAAPALVVSLHDVCPATRAACTQILAELAAMGARKTSLLVVPDHHGRGHFLADRPFCDWLTGLLAAGHEPVVHGYRHRRERRPGETLRERLLTRLYTADEGEFFDLGRAPALALARRGREELRTLVPGGIAPAGFIAPAWLLGPEAEAAVADAGFRYTVRLGGVIDLRHRRYHASQSLVYSTRAVWRRLASLGWNARLFRRLGGAGGNPLLRLSLHPPDLFHPAIWRQIRRLTRRALAVREPITYLEWVTRWGGT